MCAELARSSPHVVALQEVREAQASVVAERLGLDMRWHRKHGLASAAEGEAVLSQLPIGQARRVVLTHALPWSWRRRIAQITEIGRPAVVVVVNTHLSAHDAAARREHEATILARQPARGPTVVAGDLNDDPGARSLAVLEAAGFADAWAIAGTGDGSTNWTPGSRASRPPTQRIDYVLAGRGVTVLDASLPPAERHDQLGRLSDHLPLTVRIRVPG